MGLAQLAVACDRTLRRRGANDLWNITFRRGEGPPYRQVVAALANRKGVAVGSTLEQTERALLERWVEEGWSTIPQEARDRVWEQLRIQLPAPEDGREALVSIQTLKTGSYYALALATVGILRVLPPLIPLAGCLVVGWFGRPRDDVLLPAVLEVATLRQALRHRITVGVVGSPSSGKDAAIKAIFDVDSGNIDPVAGSTRTVEIVRLPRSTALYVVNTPGMGDVLEEVTEEARQVLDLIDVYIYVVNAQGGVQARELADYRACRSRGRPVLAVLNKIDTIREEDRARYVEDARNKLGASEEDFCVAAFDPLPQLAPAPLGVDEVRAWVGEHLAALGKDPRELPWEHRSLTDGRCRSDRGSSP